MPGTTHTGARTAMHGAPPRVQALGAMGQGLNARPAVVAQRALAQGLNDKAAAARPNRTGLPDALKTGIEAMSGLSMDDVRVHRNSAQPAQLNAKAYAQGTDIHLAPGQDRHLPHEAWHVVQQKQGRVRPTVQLKGGIPVNDDSALEREADIMGAKAAANGRRPRGGNAFEKPKAPRSTPPLQGEFSSIPEARRAAGDAQANPNARLEAETYLRHADPAATSLIQALVARGDLEGALARATVLAGLPGGRYQVRPTADYASVVGGAPIPQGGTPSGVTVMEQASPAAAPHPVIYIHENKIRKWVNSGDIGNLLSTIRHEATHADQYLRLGPRPGEDEQEFEAYAAEITHTQELFAAGEDGLLPSSAHLAESYEKATNHYAALPGPVPQQLMAIKAQIDRLYPRLKRHLEENDKASGRVDRITNTTRTALRTYIDDPTTPHPDHAYNEYSKIPDQFRGQLDTEFKPLFEQAQNIRNRRWFGGLEKQ